jgi:competence protein ComGC
MNVATGKEKGQGLTEFALIILVVVIAVVAVLLLLGPEVTDWYQIVVDSFEG